MSNDFSNYLFDVKVDKNDAFEFSHYNGLTYDEMLAETKMTHHSQLVNFINECQTYPSFASQVLAVVVAGHFNPKQGRAFPSQERLAELLGGVSLVSVRKYTRELESTGYWEIDRSDKGHSYRLTFDTLIVFTEWLKRDRDADTKGRWGFNTPTVMLSNSNMARKNNPFKKMAEENKITAKNYEQVRARKSEVDERIESDKVMEDAMHERAVRVAAAEIDDILRFPIRSIVNQCTVARSLTPHESDKLVERLIDFAQKSSENTPDALMTHANELMTTRT